MKLPHTSSRLRKIAALVPLTAMLLAASWQAVAASLPADTEQAIDGIVAKALKDSQVPSVSVAIVRDGQLAFAKAYGEARLAPDLPASPAMRYKIASNSKQITATAILLLAEEHKLSLDDRVARYFPKLTRAKDITLRQLLTHTSGYTDYYAVDYLAPSLQHPTTAQGILDIYAMRPLDFEPGTRWEYSNTNYVLLGCIAEKVSGQPLIVFLRQRIFDKLGMASAIDADSAGLGADDPKGYTRYALGPVREVAPEGKGWMWAMGELAMTASDLAKWDISLMNGSILKPASLKAMTTEMNLSSGSGSGYGFGLSVSQLENGHRRWAHTGGASGFLSINVTYPDDRTAITVLSNGEGQAYRGIAAELEKLLLTGAIDTKAESSKEDTRRLLAALQKGTPDRAMLTDDLSGYFNGTALADFSASLAPLGEIASISQIHREERGGMVYRIFKVKMAGEKTLRVAVYIKPDGRFDQFLVSEMPS